METSVIIFSVVMILSAISFVAAIGVLLYYKLRNFQLKGEMSLANAAKELTTVSVGVNVSVLISFAATLVSIIIPPLAFLGIWIVLAICGVSIVIGPAVGLLGIVFSSVSVKRDAAGETKYIWASALSMLFSLILMFEYAQMIVFR